MKHFLGMDIGKESIKCALVDDEGEVLKTSPFANDLAGFADLRVERDSGRATGFFVALRFSIATPCGRSSNPKSVISVVNPCAVFCG